MKLVGLLHMVKTGSVLSWLPQSFKSGRFLTHAVNSNGNQMFPNARLFNESLVESVER